MFIQSKSLIDLDIYITRLDGINNNFLSESVLNNINTPEASNHLKNTNHTYHEDTVLIDTPELKQLSTLISATVSDFLQKKYIIESIWALVLNKNQSVMAHSHKSNKHMHPKEYFSIAYYPLVPEGSSELIFNVTYCNTMEETHRIKPEEGMLVIFNSFIPHMTSVHDSDKPRIVISANLSPENPNKEIIPDYSPYKLRSIL